MATFYRKLGYRKLGLHTALATKDVTVFCFRSIHKALQPVKCLIENRKDLRDENTIFEGILIQISPIAIPKESNGRMNKCLVQ